jgi:hypothetical protein
MIVIGLDLHKQSVTAVAVDEAGRPLAEKVVGSAAASCSARGLMRIGVLAGMAQTKQVARVGRRA